MIPRKQPIKAKEQKNRQHQQREAITSGENKSSATSPGSKETTCLVVWGLLCCIVLLAIAGVVLDPKASRGELLGFASLFGIYVGVWLQSLLCGMFYGFLDNYRIIWNTYTQYTSKSAITVVARQKVHYRQAPFLVRVTYQLPDQEEDSETVLQITKSCLLQQLEERHLVPETPFVVIPGFHKSGHNLDFVHICIRNYKRAIRWTYFLLFIMGGSFVAFVTWLMILLPELERKRYSIGPSLIGSGILLMFVGRFLAKDRSRVHCQAILNPSTGVRVEHVIVDEASTEDDLDMHGWVGDEISLEALQNIANSTKDRHLLRDFPSAERAKKFIHSDFHRSANSRRALIQARTQKWEHKRNTLTNRSPNSR